MADIQKPAPGQIGWMDLTVADAEGVREFYQQVTGWSATPVAMGEYNDYCMDSADGKTVAGICHARGVNADLPAAWMVYITVADLDESMRRCLAGGGKVRVGPKNMGRDRYCVIEDPAGAVAALYESKT